MNPVNGSTKTVATVPGHRDWDAYRIAAYNSTGATATSGCASAIPSGITLTATGSKQHGQNVATLSWQGASPVEVFRDGTSLGPVAGSSWSDNALPKGGGSYAYRVCGAPGATCSNTATVTF